LAFDAEQFTPPIKGFGYLIPRTTPAAENPHHALGVILDSDSMPGLDTTEKAYTKLTVMIGGHYWAGLEIPTQLPTIDGLKEHALETLRLQLGLPQAIRPVAELVHYCYECIPQYVVGHNDRLDDMHKALREEFGGRLSLVGASYGGVGVNSVVKSASDAVERLTLGVPTTGLEPYVRDPAGAVTPPATTEATQAETQASGQASSSQGQV
jgi:oxygen-dependent protoporphyrinogen oxidase